MEDLNQFYEKVLHFAAAAKTRTERFFYLFIYSISVVSPVYALASATAEEEGVYSPNWFYILGVCYVIPNMIASLDYQFRKKFENETEDVNSYSYDTNSCRHITASIVANTKAGIDVVSETLELGIMNGLCLLTILDAEDKRDQGVIVGTMFGFLLLNFVNILSLRKYKNDQADHLDYPPDRASLLQACPPLNNLSTRIARPFNQLFQNERFETALLLFNKWGMNSLLAASLFYYFGDIWLYNGPGDVEDRQKLAIGTAAAGILTTLLSNSGESVLLKYEVISEQSIDTYRSGMLRVVEFLTACLFFTKFGTDTVCDIQRCQDDDTSTSTEIAFGVSAGIGALIALLIILNLQQRKPHRTYNETLFGLPKPDRDNGVVDPHLDGLNISLLGGPRTKQQYGTVNSLERGAPEGYHTPENLSDDENVISQYKS